MKKICFLIMIFFIVKNVYAQDSATTTYTLQQCIETAIQNNADVKTADFTAQTNKVNWQQARGNALPFTSGDIVHGINQGRSINPYTNTYINQQNNFANYSLNASLNLWNGSSVTNNIRGNRLYYQASEMDLQQTKDNVMINVILAYLQVLSNMELFDEANKQVDVTQKQVDRLNLQNDEGAIPPATLYDLKGQLGAEQLNAINAKNAVENAKISLVQLMNVPYSQNIILQNIPVDSSLVMYDATASQVYQQALKNLSLIKAADLRKQSAYKFLKSARGALFPTLSLNGGLFSNYSSTATTSQLINTSDVQTDNYIMYNNDKLFLYEPQQNFSNNKITYFSQLQNNFNSTVNVGIAIPILNGLYAQSKLRQARISVAQNNFNDTHTKTALQQNVEQAYLNMSAAFDRYQTSRQQVKDFTSSFHSADIKFNEGVLTSVDYMVAKNNVDQAEINLISAKYDYALRLKILDYYQGKPLW